MMCLGNRPYINRASLLNMFHSPGLGLIYCMSKKPTYIVLPTYIILHRCVCLYIQVAQVFGLRFSSTQSPLTNNYPSVSASCLVQRCIGPTGQRSLASCLHPPSIIHCITLGSPLALGSFVTFSDEEFLGGGRGFFSLIIYRPTNVS